MATAERIEGDRRSVLKAIGGAALVVTANAVMSPREAWGLAATGLKPASLQTLILMARDIYPHAQLADRYYAIAVKDFDARAAKDAAFAEMIENGVADLDRRSYAGLKSYDQRVAILKSIEPTPFFQAIRGGLVTGIYNQKEVWPIFGYEGESASKGGYLDRGFNDIEWL
jgi:hypothetical protein